jgi:16S rRNA (adenine(1408)-N(1))-methyltransferase
MARKAGRKPARGGVDNLICIAAAAESLSAELPAVADHISIVLPWSRLLATVAQPVLQDLRAIAALGREGATLDVVFSYAPDIDLGAGLQLPAIDRHHVDVTLPAAYRDANLRVRSIAPVFAQSLKEFPSTWMGRLAHGRAREFWRIRGVVDAAETRLAS